MTELNDEKLYMSDTPDSPGHTPVYAIGENGVRSELDLRRDLEDHSPSGFSWGYAGAGPSQLALAILADARGDEYALANYMNFRSVIATRDPDRPLRISETEIDAALE